MNLNRWKKLSSFGIDLDKTEETIRTNRKLIFTVAAFMLCVMFLAALAAFFISVKSPERVMVPDVTGKDLTDALQEMQAKELYPKIRLRYSKSPEEKGSVLEQSPSGGTIVKAGERINLTVSQGVVLDRVENYVGMKIDDVRAQLQTLFASSSVQMIKLPDVPIYKEDAAEAGTILEQNPQPNTNLSSPVTLELVVSSGPGREEVPVPNIVGLSLNDTLLQMSRSKIIFNFTAQLPSEGQKAGTVISQGQSGDRQTLPAYSRVDALIAIPDSPTGNLIYGILDENLPPYPYALPVELKAETPEGNAYSIVVLQHTGNRLTIPYAVPRNTRLILTVSGNEIRRFTVE